jgi:protein O-GlcNAc transferase
LNRSDKRRQAKGSGATAAESLLLLRQGLALQRQNRLDEAAACYRSILMTMPGMPQANHLLGLVEHQRGEPDQAAERIGRAIAADPTNAVYRTDFGIVLRAMRRPAEAVQSLAAADRLRPGEPRTLAALAGAHLDLGQVADAVSAFRRAVAAAPLDASLHGSLGNVLNMLGESDAAFASFHRSLELHPAAATHSNFGHALAGTGALDAAIEQYHAALRLEPEMLAARMNLAFALKRQGKLPEAGEAFEAALRANPKAVDTIIGYANLLARMGRLSAALEQFERVLQHDPDNLTALSKVLFLQNYFGDQGPGTMLPPARRFGELAARAAGPQQMLPNDRDPARRLRIGLVSGDLHAHPVGRFLVAPLAEIDPAQLELFAYSVSPTEDALTQRLRTSIPNWRQVAHLDAARLAAAIRADQIDILIDLSGHSGDNRLLTFARKPAPIAVTWLGYFATTGIAAIDFVLCNKWLIPEGEEGQWLEKPWRMPDSYFCFSAPSDDVPLAPPPSASAGFITFGSFNNINKLNARTAALWAAALTAVPNSRLLLRSEALQRPETASEVRQRFVALGIAPERLLLEGHLSDYATHLRSYGRVDIALDSTPYAGGTTTVEALWMGVPVLTLAGDRFVAHMGENVLHHAGLPGWIAADSAQFALKAAAFAEDSAGLAALRQFLREHLRTSPLFDAPRFARDFETAMRQMWQTWCNAERAET